MPQLVKDLMTPDPKVLPKTATLKEAAELMRDDDIGDVIVVNNHKKIYGIVTDRDVAVRGVAEGADPAAVTLEEIASKDVTTLSPESSVEEAVRIMRAQAIRRLPICNADGKPVGIVSLGDLAIERDPTSALADISAAPASDEGPAATGMSASARTAAAGIGGALPAAAVGAGLVVAVDYVRNRGKKRPVKVAAKKLRKAGKKLRRSGDKVGSDATAQAAKYASVALKEIRSQGKRLKGEAEEETAHLSRQAEGRAKQISKRAERKARDLSKKAEKTAEEIGKKAERKAKDLGKKAEKKAEEVREMVGAGKR
ncbi:MAG TPA: CBS domain-containing protein [Actinomycetota bacterium]|nr:CBS domain-containing protein [Actinomycetota bacterium]